MTLATFTEATSWLRDHADELQEAPVRLHDAALGESGAPRYSAAFWALLVSGPYAKRSITEKRDCSISHAYGDPCDRCDGNLTYDVERELYRFPLAAALASLRHVKATSADWPRPYKLVIVLMRCNYDLALAAEVIGHPILSLDHYGTVEAAFLNAIRKLWGKWASGPLPKARQISEAQGDAEAA